MSRNGFGSVRRKRSGNYQARYRDLRGEDHYRTFTTSAEAHQFLATVHADMLRGEWIAPDRGRITLAAWSESWLAAKRNLRPNTVKLYRGLLRNQILPHLGDRTLASLTPEDIDAWLATLGATPGLSSSTANRAFRLLSQMLKGAVRYRRIPANPCDPIHAPADQRHDTLFIGPAHVAALADTIGAAHRPYRSLVLLAAYAGLRWGECVGLPIRNVDPLRGTVRVDQQLHSDGRLDAPKSAESNRTVRIPRWLGDELAATIATRQPSPTLRPDHEGLVFLTPGGHPVRQASNFNRRYWRPAVTTALPYEFHALRFHDLRHSAVAIAIDAATRSGEPLNVKALQTRLGHSTIRLTLDRYGHLFPGHDDGLISGMDNPFSEQIG